MRRAIWKAGIALAAAALSGPACADGLDLAHAGLGLRQPRPALEAAKRALADMPGIEWQTAEGGDALYAGHRTLSGIGLAAREAVSGVAYTLSPRFAASLEIAHAGPTALAPNRYTLAGHVHTAGASGVGLSVGLAYRLYDSAAGMRLPATGIEAPGRFALVSVPATGTGLAPAYQLQVQYQYSPATTFGVMLGRDLDTYAYAPDRPAPGLRLFSFSGRHWLTPSWALSYDLLSDDPGSLRVQGLRLGMRYRF